MSSSSLFPFTHCLPPQSASEKDLAPGKSGCPSSCFAYCSVCAVQNQEPLRGGEGTAAHYSCSSEQAALSSCSKNRNVPAGKVPKCLCCQKLGAMFCLCQKKRSFLRNTRHTVVFSVGNTAQLKISV